MKIPRYLPRLLRIDRLVEADPRPRTIRQLRTLLGSKSRDTRLSALARIRKQIQNSGLRQGYFHLARPLTLDSDSDCRWQATIIIGEFIEDDPERVWRVARELAMSPKADVRTAAATVLLEHLLQYHPKKMITRFRQELRGGDKRFADALDSCWNFGSGANEQKIQTLLDEARKTSRKTRFS